MELCTFSMPEAVGSAPITNEKQEIATENKQKNK